MMNKELCPFFIIDWLVIYGRNIEGKGFGVCARKWDVRCSHVLRTCVPDIHSMALVSTVHLVYFGRRLDYCRNR